MNSIENLIKQGESKTLEFVTSPNDKDIISSHVAALLNSGGGRLLIGVDDNKRVAGIPEAEKVAGELQAFLIKAISPKALFSVGIEHMEKIGTAPIFLTCFSLSIIIPSMTRISRVVAVGHPHHVTQL